MRYAPTDKRPRIGAALLVAAVHTALVLVLLLPGGPHPVPASERPSLTTYDVPAIVPPPASAPLYTEAAAAPSAPVGVRARRSMLIAPVIAVPPPAPVLAAIVADVGSASVGGTADAGTGTGAGGVGSGDGAGGTGGDGGGLATRSRRLSGDIRPADYPAAERRARVEGSVTVRFTVGADGQVRDCAVERSSGNAALDATTCDLIERRFRYAPATDRLGRQIAEERGWRQDWWLGNGVRPNR